MRRPDRLQRARRRIARFKVPEQILPIDASSRLRRRGANGNKVQKAKLRDIAHAALNR